MINSDYKDIFEQVKAGKISRKEAASIIERLWADKKNNPVFYATPEWREAGEIESISLDDPLRMIIFNYDSLSDSIRQRLSSRKNRVIVPVTDGTRYKKNGDSYTINYRDIKQLTEFMQAIGSLKDYRILFICKQYEDVTEENIRTILDENIIPLFLLIQACINLKSDYPICVSCVFSVTDNYLHALYAGLSGFARTLKQESTKVACKIIETDDTEKNLDRIIIEACDQNTDYTEIKITDKRFIKSFREISGNEYNPKAVSFKKNGVYLITGGAGGLGLIFSEYLAREYQAKLILAGRSALGADKSAKIKQIEETGGEVLYVRGDITKLSDVKALVATSKGKFGHINGVLHTAGIIKDTYIREKQIEEIQTVIAPKLSGTLFLDFDLKEEKLDFFVLFSSIAVLGNQGQSDYSYANSFMDYFASVRNMYTSKNKRKGKTLSINWPYWAQGGMNVEQSTIQFLERTKGLKPLKTQNGIKAINDALKFQYDQFAILPGDKQRIMKSLLNVKDDSQRKAETQTDDNIPSELQNFILDQIGNILKVNASDIDIHMDLSEYGCDMIGFTDLATLINEKYNLSIVPTIFLETPSVASFVQHLLNEHGDILASERAQDEKHDKKSKSNKNANGNRRIDMSIALKAFLIETIASILKMDKGEIDTDADMSIYGFDSIGFTNLANSINNKYNLALTPAVFYEYPSIQSLIDFIQSRYKDELVAFFNMQMTDNEVQANDADTDHQSDDISDADESMGTAYRFLPDEADRFSTEISAKNEPIAIIGIAGIMPGAENLDEFWKNLVEGKDCITEIPSDRWDWREYWGDPATEENKTNVKWGGFIKDIDKFDAGFFEISPYEAILMDPQHRLFLEIVWKVIENAGYKASALSESFTGVFVGVQNMEYGQLILQNKNPIEGHFATGNSLTVLANRISYIFNFHGPSESIDAACASSLVAINRAIQAIMAGDCKQAIAGGVNSLLLPNGFIAMNKAGALSPDGRCKTFNNDANGYVRAEGVGAVFLKPLNKAIKDRDNIYAIIRGSAENHGGRAKSLTSPNPNIQAELIVKAMERANIDPATVTYLEAHGTGTSLGDPIEINGLKKAYKELYSKWNKNDYGKLKHCGIGAVKTNIGHLESAAGIAGVLKILLAMKNKKLPGTVHFNILNPYISLDDSPFYIVKDTREWNQIKDSEENLLPRRAGVSSFGFGGANAHIVLEEYKTKIKQNPENGRQHLIVFSAKTKEALNKYINIFNNWLFQQNSEIDLESLEYTLQIGRENFSERLAIVVSNLNDLLKKLDGYIQNGLKIQNIYRSSNQNDRKTIESILGSEEGKELIEKMIANRNLEKLAQLWVNGSDINWNLLYTNRLPQRMALPGYQFNKLRYWIPNNSQIDKNNSFSMQSPALHLLIDVNISTLKEEAYTKRFYDCDFFARDHAFNNISVVPGLTLLEMARAAGELALETKITQISNSIFGSPVLGTKDGNQVKIRLIPIENRINFEIINYDDENIIHSQGSLETSLITNLNPLNKIDIENIKKDLPLTIDIKEFYDSIEPYKMKHGKTGRVIKEVYISEKMVLGRMIIDEEVKNFQGFILHPSLMDGSLHVALCIDYYYQRKRNPNVLFAVNRINIYKPLTDEVYVLAKPLKERSAAFDNQRYEVGIYNTTGDILVSLYGVQFKEIDADSFQQSIDGGAESNNKLLFFQPEWIDKNTGQYDTKGIDSLILFDDDDVLFNKFKGKSVNITLIKQGSSFNELDNNIYEFNPDEDDYKKLISSLLLKKIAINNIVINWNDRKNLDIEIDPKVNENLIKPLYHLLILTKILLESKLNQKIHLLYLNNEEINYIQTYQNSIFGFMCTLRMENPNFTYKLLNINQKKVEGKTIIDVIKTELSAISNENMIKYENNNRKIKVLKELNPVFQDTLIRQNGTYLITGGLGGLGIIVAQYLVSRYSANLILINRSPLDESRQRIIDSLQKDNNKVFYFAGDVSSLNDMQKISDAIQRKNITLNGIIHTAGILHDSYIIKKDWMTFKDVLLPKIFGTVYLDTVFTNIKLDFFIMFSSISAIFGNPGQSDYATGNAFMDHFAGYRNKLAKEGKRYGFTVSINWPLWEEGGMKIDQEIQKMNYNKSGMATLDTNSGIEAFESALKARLSQFIVLYGNRAKILSYIKHDFEEPINALLKQPVSRSNPDIQTRNEILPIDAIYKYLKEILAEQAKLPIDQISIEENFEKYGIDSLLIMKLNNRIENDLGQIPKTLFFEYRNIKELGKYLNQFRSEELKVVLYKNEIYNKKIEIPENDNDFEYNENNILDSIKQYLKIILAEEAKISINEINENEKFEHYGIDSLLIMKLNNRIEKDLGNSSKTLFFEYATINQLSSYFLTNHSEYLKSKYSIPNNKIKETTGRLENKKHYRDDRISNRFINQQFVKSGSHTPLSGETEIKDVAIIGISIKYPLAEDIEEFWENLKQGKDCITEIPLERWDYRKYYNPDKSKKGSIYCKWGGFISDVEKFDPLFFKISPKEAIQMDPQERLFLETAWKCLEDAGYTPESLNKITNANVGVFVGTGLNDYQLFHSDPDNGLIHPEVHGFFISNRVSFYFGFQGPSLSIDTACASSLTALHYAYKSICSGESKAALAGGVNINLQPSKYFNLSAISALSSHGRCKAFGKDGDGYVPGEGVGAVLLKPLSEAIKDGDIIYGIIKGSAVNHGGNVSGFTVPNPNAQSEVIIHALKDAGIDARTISYIEAHGTGTSLGDPVEVRGLSKAFDEFTKDKHFCRIGSVKSNIGHLECAAGISQLTKVLLQMKYKMLVPSLYCDELNEKIDFENSPFIVQKKLEEWKRPVINIERRALELPRRAGISSFGIGGANAHVVLEEYIPEKPVVTINSNKEYLIKLSAKTIESLRRYTENIRKWLGRNKGNYNLNDIEFTLLIGREEFKERLAIIAKNEKDLIEKFEAYNSSKDKIKGLYSGSIKKKSNTEDTASVDVIGQDVIERLLKEKNIEKIAELWVSGFPIDWELYLQGAKGIKVALPTYPFEKKRYWITESEYQPGKQQNAKFIHPLIDYNDSTLFEQKFIKVFTGNEIYLADHIVHGQKVLPGVVYLEYARAAGEAATGKKIQQIKNILWRRPFIADGDSQNLNIRLIPEKNRIHYDFYTPTDNEKLNIIFSQGELLYNEIGNEINSKLDIPELEKGLTGTIEADTCYRKIRDSGLIHGKSFQVIKKIRYDHERVLSYLEMTDEIFSQYKDFTLIPSIMDGALQSVIGLNIDENSSGTYLPFSLETLEIIKPMTKKCYAYIQKNTGFSLINDGLCYNISIYDETGNVLVRMYNFVVKELKQLPAAGKKEKQIGCFYIKDKWVERNLIGDGEKVESILILDTDDILSQKLKNKLEDVNIINVKSADEYREIDDSQYEINIKDREDYKRLFTTLKEKRIKVRKIIHNISKEVFQLNNIESQLHSSIYSMFVLCQELFSQKLKGSVQIVYLYNKESEPIYSGISGFVRSAGLENTKVRYKLIGVEKDVHIDYPEMIMMELKAQDGSCEEIIYRGKGRFVKQYGELDFEKESKEEYTLRQNGVYIITGGAGALGLLFAGFIAEQVKGRLILIGRSGLKLEQEERIRKIEDKGAEVIYIKADVSKKEDVKNLVKDAKERYGHIDGVIHAAGLLRDNYIIKKTNEEIDAVIAPKVYGTLLLDEALKDEKLDFFVLFSSMAVMGNAGQCDYAFANSFMNYFAEKRNSLVKNNERSGKTLSINWPLWKEGGMHVDKKTEEYQFNTIGILPLSTVAGLDAFVKGLKTEVNHFAVVEGDVEKINEKIGIYSEKVKTTTGEKNTCNTELLRNKVEDQVTTIIIDILKIGRDAIHKETNLNEYGFDSVSFTELAYRINQYFVLKITPAIFYEYATIQVFVNFMVDEYSEKIIRTYPELIKTERVDSAEMRETIGKGNQKQLETEVVKFLIEFISAILKVAKVDLYADRNMSDYGFDSITHTELANRINQQFSINITPAIFFEYTTINDIAEYLSENYQKALLKKFRDILDLQKERPVEKVQDTVLIEQEQKPVYKRFIKDDFNEKVVLNEPIAIIGMAGIMPGAANLDEFWKNLEQGKDCITEIPPDRWDWREYWGDPAQEENKINVKWGGFINDIDKFDAGFFGISPQEAILMDPQHRLLLEIVWKTIEDAGYKTSDLAGSLTGVFTGVMNTEYLELLHKHNISIDMTVLNGNSNITLATQISYLFNFIGPSQSMNAVCASSVVALHKAIQSIQSGDCNQAIVGGANISLNPETYIILNNIFKLLSNDGHHIPFSKNAKGYIKSEGIAALFLKPLSAALQCGDHIHAIIKGSAETHGGKTNTPTSPNPVAQAECIIKAMERADIDPSTVTYIEAFSIASQIGDPIEINGLKRAYNQLYKKWCVEEYENKHCGIGSIKGNIGHTEAASGIIGIIKVILAMKNKKLPGILHFDELNPYITLEDCPFYIVKDTQEWKQIKDKSGNLIPKRAGINNFNFISTSTHVVLEEYIPNESIVAVSGKKEYLITLSAKTNNALKTYAADLKRWLETNKENAQLTNIEYTLLAGREEFEERLAFIVKDKKDLLEKLEAFCTGKDAVEGIIKGNIKTSGIKAVRIFQGNEGKEFLKNLINNKKVNEIAELWVSGFSINWELYNNSMKGNRISLPTYPFEKKRFWIEKKVVAEKTQVCD